MSGAGALPSPWLAELTRSISQKMGLPFGRLSFTMCAVVYVTSFLHPSLGQQDEEACTLRQSLSTLLPGEKEFENMCFNGERSILNQYLDRHKRAIEYLRRDQEGASTWEGEDLLNRVPKEERPKFLVWRCSEKSRMGGIGDRLKRLGGLFTTAIATGRILLIDFSDFSDVFEPRFPAAEWRFSVLEEALKAKTQSWWFFKGDSDEDDTVSMNGRSFANLTAISTSAMVEIAPRTNPLRFSRGAIVADFDDDVRD